MIQQDLGLLLCLPALEQQQLTGLMLAVGLLFLISIAGVEEVLDYHIVWCFNSHLCVNWLRPLLCLFRALGLSLSLCSLVFLCVTGVRLGNITFDLVFPIKLINLIISHTPNEGLTRDRKLVCLDWCTTQQWITLWTSLSISIYLHWVCLRVSTVLIVSCRWDGFHSQNGQICVGGTLTLYKSHIKGS